MTNPVLSVLAGELPDRLPVAPAVGVDHAARRAGVPLRDAMSDAVLMADVILGAAAAYEPDLLLVFSDVTVEAEAMGSGVVWPEGAPPRVSEPAGADAIRALDPEKDGRLPVVLAAARRVIRETGGEIPVLVSLKGPFSLAALVAGLDVLLTDAIEDPARARRRLAMAAESQTAFARAIVRVGGIPLVGDPFASGSVLGPRHFRELALPALARVVAEIRGLGSRAAVHVCGDVDPILPDLLHCGADLYHLEHADFGAVAAAGAAAMGGVPTEGLLESDDAVRAGVAAALARRTDPRHFVLSTACDVPTDATEARVRLLVRTARETG